MKKLSLYVWVLAVMACNAKGPGGAPDLHPAASATAATNVAGAVPAASGAAAVTAVTSASARADEAAKMVTYAVIGVASNDVLNVREKPDAASKKLYSYGPTAKNIRGTGQHQEKGSTPWVEVAFDGGTGWVNRLFLTETPAGAGCNDPILLSVIREFMRAVSAKDGAALKVVTSPLRGLTIIAEHAPVTIPYAKIETLFSSPTSFTWGTADGSGAPIVGTFHAVVEDSLRRSIVGKGAKESCGKLITGGSASTPPTADQYAGTPFVSFFFPAEEGGGGWVTWVATLEYVDSKPYISSLEQYHWEI